MFSKIQTYPFIKSLWEMVERKDTDDLISWRTDGIAFVIKNEYEFSSKLLPSYFKHSNMQSFVRNLNFYGFHKLMQIGGPNKGKSKPEFANPYFMRDNPDLLVNITRKISDTKIINDTFQNSKNKFKYMTNMKSDLNRILVDVKQIKVKFENICNVIDVMKQDNANLKSEVATLRLHYVKQQQIMNYIIRFQMALVQPINQPDDPKLKDVRFIGPYGPLPAEYAPKTVNAKLNSSTDYVHSQIKSMILDEYTEKVVDLTEDDTDDNPTIIHEVDDHIETLHDINMSSLEDISNVGGQVFIKTPVRVYQARPPAKRQISSRSTTEDADLQMTPPAPNTSQLKISVVPGAGTLMICREDAEHNLQTQEESSWQSNDANISTDLKELGEKRPSIEKIVSEYDDQSVTLSSQEIKNEPQDEIDNFNHENVSRAMIDVSDEVDPMQTDFGPLNEFIYNNDSCSNDGDSSPQVKNEIDVSSTVIQQRSTCDSRLIGHAETGDRFDISRILFEDDSDDGSETSYHKLFTPGRMSPMEECSENDWAVNETDLEDAITAVRNKPTSCEMEAEAEIHDAESGESKRREGEAARHDWEASGRLEWKDAGTHKVESVKREEESGEHEGESERREEELGADNRESPETAQGNISCTSTTVMEPTQLSTDIQNVSKLIATHKLPDPDMSKDKSKHSLKLLKNKRKFTVFSLQLGGRQLRKTTALAARHAPLHTDERRFACDECDKRFKVPGHLLKHKKKHLINRS